MVVREQARRLANSVAKLDLRFEDAVNEAAYARSREGFNFTIMLFLLVGCTASLFFSLAALVVPEMQRTDNPFELSLGDPRMLPVGAMVVNMLLNVAIIVAIVLRSRRGWFSCLSYDLFMGMILLYCPVFFLMSRTQSSVYLAGASDAKHVWVHDTLIVDILFGLGLDTFVTGMCLLRFVRVHLLFLLIWSIFFLSVGHIIVFGTADALIMVGVLASVVGVVLCALASAWLGERFEREKWRQAQELEQQRTELCFAQSVASSMTAIAESLCDLVFQLGQESEVSDDNPAHESFFGRGICGQPFIDVIAPKDHSRFHDVLERTAGSSIPQCIPITLLCATGTVEAQMLIAKSSSEQLRYVIGMRTDIALGMIPLFAGQSPPALRERDEDEDIIMESASQFNSVSSSAITAQVFCDIKQAVGNGGAGGAVPEQTQAHLENFAAVGCREHWLVGSTEIQLFPKTLLGQGGFAAVFLGRVLGTPVAVKLQKTASSVVNVRYLITAANELKLHRRIRHPNICLFFGACIDPVTQDLALIFELISGMNLHRFVASCTQVDEGSSRLCRAKVLLDVACALRYLHGLEDGIVHGDLKPENIIVERLSGRAKLLDFGLARSLAKASTRLGGTRSWMAPEARRGTNPATSDDTFALGLVVYFTVLAREPPVGWAGEEAEDDGPFPAWLDSTPPPEQYAEICRSCLYIDPRLRPPMASVHGMLVEALVKGWADCCNDHNIFAQSQTGEAWEHTRTEAGLTSEKHARQHAEKKAAWQAARATMGAARRDIMAL